MNKLILIVLLFTTFAFSSDLSNDIKKIDCLILEKENSIICKYAQTRSEEDRFIEFIWIDPQGEVSRERKVLLPKGHGSIYDLRYLSGRQKGSWTFKVIDNEAIYMTEFEIK